VGAAAAAEEIGKEVAEPEVLAAGSARAPAERPAGVRTLIGATRLAVGVDLAAVVLAALRRVADDVVGRRNALEALLRARPVAGIEIGMQLLGELTVGAADLLIRRVTRHAKHRIGVFGHLRRPSSLPPTRPAARRAAHFDSGWPIIASPSTLFKHAVQGRRSRPPAGSGAGARFAMPPQRPPRTSGVYSITSAKAAKRRRSRSPSKAACGLGIVSTHRV